MRLQLAVCPAYCAHCMLHQVCPSSYSLHQPASACTISPRKEEKPKKTGPRHPGPPGVCPTGVVTALLLISAKSFGFPLPLTPSHTLLHATLTCC